MDSLSSAMQPRPPETWDSMLPGPANRSNGGAADCSPAGLLAYGAGSSVVIVDPRSMQLVSVLPMPSTAPQSFGSITALTSALALAPFVTSVRWSCQTVSRDLSIEDDPSNSHLSLAVGDRQGRIAIWDFRSRSVFLWLELDHFSHGDRPKLGIQDLCWVRSNSWLVAAIHGPSLLVLWNAATGRCLWKYDTTPEYLVCIRRDPFDWRHFCVLGLRGFLLSVIVLGEGNDDVSLQEQQIPGVRDSIDVQKTEKESSAGSTAPALAVFPQFYARLCFSPRWRHIVMVTFPKDLIVFDLQYQASLFSAPLPRGCSKFMDVLPDPDIDLLYCVHLDGILSIWKRKEGEQVYMLRTMEELMPSIGTSIPSPTILSVVLCQSESAFQNVGSFSIDSSSTSSIVDSSTSLNVFGGMDIVARTTLISISDDGKIWNWLMTSEKARNIGLGSLSFDSAAVAGEGSLMDAHSGTTSNYSTISQSSNVKNSEHTNSTNVSKAGIIDSISSTKIGLVGQLHLLSSTVTTLSVPSPSLLATLARGGNSPAAAVPLVALGTQSGTIDVIDVSANAVAASFFAHNGVIKGLRWLGNSRLVTFSFNQANDRTGGYVNKLVVTCLRSGLNRAFRVHHKPERAPIRALKASSSGRYLLILFRDAPVEVWAMTKTPIMIRSLALPFTVMEWTLPTVTRPPSTNSSFPFKPPAVTSTTNASFSESKIASTDSSGDDLSESFAFALVNGALGVFEVHGRRIRDFKPKWPSSSFVSSDGLVTAMAYRLPHVVMGDRLGSIRWWDVTTGLSSSFNTHRDGIRRIKFSPVVPGDRSRGRIAVLFYDNTFSIFDLDTSDPLAFALLQPQSTGTLVLELDWLPMRTKRDEPLVLCIAGADSSFRLIEVGVNDIKASSSSKGIFLKERFRPMPLCLPVLFPTAHALALRMIIQSGVKSSWFSLFSAHMDTSLGNIPEIETTSGDLRGYIIESKLPSVGDSVVPELLLKVLEPYRRDGCILDDERVRLYASLANKGFAARSAFAAAIFGEFSEALFWLRLPHALSHVVDKSAKKCSQEASQSLSETESIAMLNRITSREKYVPGSRRKETTKIGQLNLMAFKQQELRANANERILWHEKLDGEEAIQKHVHELISVGDLEGAVALLLSTPPEGSNFYPNALRAVALSSAVSSSLHELAVKVVAANMIRTDKSLSGTHLLCAVGRHQEACSQLQDAGCWIDAATLASTHLHGSDYARVLQRWANNVLHNEHDIWRALILYVAAGALHEAFSALRDAKLPDTAAMFLVACHEIYAQMRSESHCSDEQSDRIVDGETKFILPCKNIDDDDVNAVSDFYGEYQRKLIHLCMDSVPLFD
ncbi:WD repeat-containing protein 11-like isoform X2 [Phalaenopsis equestris]|uniref:WD repeat-containing protein 11-like isoform X2 n=1 Tax=Phalaenopsis equestris TaxID=78828 RepID=UPI0009E524AD|nr:WD repeat-containing protein 11-like isoform X2 [Phalaenopsis equestris]